MSESNPYLLPPWVAAVLERIVPHRYHDDVIGDFGEAYSWIAKEEGRWSACRWYLVQLMKTLPAFLFEGISLGGSMLRNHITVARRNLVKRKFYSGLNIAGLAVGMSICLLILQYVTFETSFDGYHEHAEDTFRINLKSFTGGELMGHDQLTAYALGPLIEERIPEVETTTRIHPVYGTATLLVDIPEPTEIKTTKFAYVDPSFFNIFDYTSISGNPFEALNSPTAVVITQAAAQQYFGTDDVLGRRIEIYSWINETYTVGAVLADHQGNSYFNATLFAPLQPLLDSSESQYANDNGWGWTNFETFALLQSDANVEAVASKIDAAMLDVNRVDWEAGSEAYLVDLQPIKSIHLNTQFEGNALGGSAYRTVLFVSIIGFFVLVIAWFNFINLSTSRAMERSLEVGIRKATGARRAQVVTQFLVESLLTNAIALGLAFGLAYYGTTWLNELANTDIPKNIWSNGRFWVYVGLFFGIGSMMASLYPSFFASRYNPAQILSGSQTTSRTQAKLRKGMVVFQFALSIALLSGAGIVYKQVKHLREVDPGFSTDQVVVVQRPGIISDVELYTANRTAFFELVRANASVESATSSTKVPGSGFNMYTKSRAQSDPITDEFPVQAFWIGTDFLETFHMSLLAGRTLDPESEFDRESALLINEEAMIKYGFENPDEALGQTIIIGSSSELEVVGVLPNFDWMSAKMATSPVLIGATQGGSFFSVRLSGGQLDESLAELKSYFDTAFPGSTFEYAFADERFNALFEDDERLMRLVTVFALFAVLVAALGLVGLAALTADRRRKEFSVRKVLGAGPMVIARLMTGQFFGLVALGAVIAFPVVWTIGSNWLDNFGSRTALTLDIFLLPAGIVLSVCMLSSAYHVWRLSVANPIDGIRSI